MMDEFDDLESWLLTMSDHERLQLGQEIFAKQGDSSPLSFLRKKPTTSLRQPGSTRLMEQAQQACGQALDDMQLNLLREALSRPEVNHLRSAEQLSSAEAMNALSCAIGETVVGLLTRDHAEATVSILKATLKAAAQLSSTPTLRPWCDARALFKDYLRLVKQQELSDEEKTYFRTLKRAFSTDLLRATAKSPQPGILLRLRQQFPNFAAPIEFLAEQAAMHQLRPDSGYHPPPMLLLGSPGIGKTRFAQALTELFTTPLVQLSLSSQSNGWNLSGLDRSWSHTKPGQIFSALMEGASMAPMVLLDEIDKANADAKSDPLGPLYQLLEPHTARRFRDEHVDFDIDASQVLWLATANDEHGIPPALLSRFMVFRIPNPSGDDLTKIASGIYRELSSGLMGAPEEMPPSWMATLKGRDLRSVRRLMQQAIGKAALRAMLRPGAEFCLTASDLQNPSPEIGNRIGFLARQAGTIAQ